MKTAVQLLLPEMDGIPRRLRPPAVPVDDEPEEPLDRRPPVRLLRPPPDRIEPPGRLGRRPYRAYDRGRQRQRLDANVDPRLRDRLDLGRREPDALDHVSCRARRPRLAPFIRPSSVLPPLRVVPALASSWWLRLPRGRGRISPAGTRLPGRAQTARRTGSAWPKHSLWSRGSYSSTWPPRSYGPRRPTGWYWRASRALNPSTASASRFDGTASARCSVSPAPSCRRPGARSGSVNRYSALAPFARHS